MQALGNAARLAASCEALGEEGLQSGLHRLPYPDFSAAGRQLPPLRIVRDPPSRREALLVVHLVNPNLFSTTM